MRVREVFDKLGRVICVMPEEEFQMSVPLERAALCVEDDTVFEIGHACPTCGTHQWVSLARLLNESRRGAITGELASRNPRPVAAPPEAFAPLVIRDGSSSTERRS